MKKKLSILLVLILAITATAAIHATATNEIVESETQAQNLNSDSVYEPSAFGDFQNESLVGSQRYLELDGKTILISYSHSWNDNNISVNERDDTYGTRDIFVDEENTEYYYLYNTDKFLGFLRVSEFSEKAQSNGYIDKENAVDIAKEYLADKIDNFDEYLYTNTVVHSYCDAYDVRFNYYLNNVKTDEVARVWITSDAEIIAAYCFDMGKYSRYNNTVDFNTPEVATYSIAEEGEDIEDRFITTDDNGQLVLYTLRHSNTGTHEETFVPIEIE